MAATLICRVCGKPYQACSTMLLPEKFSWKKVTCSPECWQDYMKMIDAARGKAAKPADEPVQEAEDQEKAPAPAKTRKKKAPAEMPENE